MKIKSGQFLLSILAGMVVGTLMTVFIQPTCLGWVVGIILACYLAKVSLPKEGALVGFLIMIPIGIYGMYNVVIDLRALEVHGALITIVFSFVSVLLICSIGALFGLAIGKLFQLAKERQVIFF